VSVNPNTALVIFSGGQDSTTCLYWALKNFDRVEAITFDYGQRHLVELDLARELCRKLNVPHKVVDAGFIGQLSTSALTDTSVEIKNDGGYQNLPSTFVPGRNVFFFSMATAYALPKGIREIVSGVCQTDYSGYPDCREDFVKALEKALSLGMDGPLTLHSPLMHLTKAETFKLAADLNCLESVLWDTNTCYQGERQKKNSWGYGCGSCPACELRKKGFEEYIKVYGNS
jgi:7-cyano-7-deazaguanine synthase